MQEPIFPSTITHKLYNERAILIATFVGGPLAGGYLLSRNFGALNEPAKASRTWIISIGVLLLLAGSSFLPAADKIPAVVYSFACCMTAHFAAKKFQGSSIALHQTNGGSFYGTWRAVRVGLLSCLLMVALFFGLVYLTDASLRR